MRSHKNRHHSSSSDNEDDRKHSKKRKSSSSNSSSDDEPHCKRHLKRKIRRKQESSTSSSSHSTSSTTSTDSSVEWKRKKKAKKLKEKVRKKREKLKSKKSKETKKNDPSADVPLELMDKSKTMAPMTKEEWEKKQSVVRRVYDESSGRHRLIKGDGEVIEEIVSRERHKAINEQATKGDGNFFQAKTTSSCMKK